jgi:hypothetical protein
MPQLTAEQQTQAKALGIDLSKIDWTKVAAIIQLLISLFSAQKQQATAALKAKGCDDGCCQLMTDAIDHNLQAAQDCVNCCCPSGGGGY